MKKNIIQLNSGNHSQDVFLIHPLGGTVFCFLPLIKYLQPTCRIYGIQDLFLAGDFKKFNSLTEMAAQYLCDLQSLVTKKRPVVLGGYSLGGTLAFELATLLQEQEFTIKRCCIFDSWPNIPVDRLFKNTLEIVIQRQMEQLQLYKFPGYQDSHQQWLDVMKNRLQIMEQYLPFRKTHFDLFLFQATEIMNEYSANQKWDYGWGDFLDTTASISVTKLIGNHETILNATNIKLSMAKQNTNNLKMMFE